MIFKLLRILLRRSPRKRRHPRPDKTAKSYRPRVRWADDEQSAVRARVRGIEPKPPQAFSTQPWKGRVVWIVDGDTIHVRRSGRVVKIRLNGLDAPEINAFGGRKAKDFMFKLVRGQELECHPTELDGYGRTVAICYLNGTDIAAEAVKAGVALDCRMFSGGRYAHLEVPGAARRLGRRTYAW